MSIIGGLDVHRAQITFDWVDRDSGETHRGQIAPATRAGLRGWLGELPGAEGAFAVEGCTGWRRARVRSHRSIGASSASKWSIWRSATARACRLAGGSATPASQPRVAPDSSPWVGRGSPW